MIKSKNKIIGILLIPIISLIGILPQVMAMCPFCTAATIIGIGISRELGLDDSIVGVFVGAMIISTALWINNLIVKRNVRRNKRGSNNFLRALSLTVLMTLLTYITFYFVGLFGPANDYRIFGMEKITFGAISGGVVSLIALFASNKIKKNNNGKVLFPYQSMAFTFALLLLNVLIFYLIFK